MQTPVAKTLASLAFFLGAVLPAGAKQFEGVVHYQLTAGKRTMENEYAIKDDRMRMTMHLGDGHSSGGIYDNKTGEMYILMPEQKMYMVFGGMREMVKDAMKQDATIEETGRTEKIAGYSCSEYVIKDKDTTVEMWATKGLGTYVSFADVQRSRGKNPPWVQLLAGKDLFPLRTITKDRRGRVQTTMEATKVESKKLDDAIFEVPKDYQRFQMPGLGGLLKGLGG